MTDKRTAATTAAASAVTADMIDAMTAGLVAGRKVKGKRGAWQTYRRDGVRVTARLGKVTRKIDGRKIDCETRTYVATLSDLLTLASGPRAVVAEIMAAAGYDPSAVVTTDDGSESTIGAVWTANALRVAAAAVTAADSGASAVPSAVVVRVVVTVGVGTSAVFAHKRAGGAAVAVDQTIGPDLTAAIVRFLSAE